jgi:beta-lactamase class D
MAMDRRTFASTILVGGVVAVVGVPGTGAGLAAERRLRATLLVDAASGKVVHRSGDCAVRASPCSTFKIPLALMGFDSGILQDAHHPAIDYDPARHLAHRAVEKGRIDPTRWEADSVVWYSQELTRKLGMARFQAYVDRFGYGNRDVSGNPGKGDGLTQAWLGSSLKISPDEQVAFLRRMLAHRLVSSAAHARTEAVIPRFAGSGGWQVHGKTGTGTMLGWFVGWADKGGRRLAFARFGASAGMPEGTGGLAMRQAMLAEIGALAG